MGRRFVGGQGQGNGRASSSTKRRRAPGGGASTHLRGPRRQDSLPKSLRCSPKAGRFVPWSAHGSRSRSRRPRPLGSRDRREGAGLGKGVDGTDKPAGKISAAHERARLRDRTRPPAGDMGQVDDLFRGCIRLQIPVDDEFEQAHSVRLDRPVTGVPAQRWEHRRENGVLDRASKTLKARRRADALEQAVEPRRPSGLCRSPCFPCRKGRHRTVGRLGGGPRHGVGRPGRARGDRCAARPRDQLRQSTFSGGGAARAARGCRTSIAYPTSNRSPRQMGHVVRASRRSPFASCHALAPAPDPQARRRAAGLRAGAGRPAAGSGACHRPRARP